ncbi:HlyD family secretion protein [compost metagenome]
MSATVDVHTNKVNKVIAVPIQAVTTREPEKDKAEKDGKKENKDDKKKTDKSEPVKSIVFVMRNGVAQAVAVTTGIQDDSFIEIKSGLKDGDQVIVAPYLAISKNLKDGDKVKKVDQEKLFSAEKKK